MSAHALIHMEGVPAYQNRMFASRADALACPRGDMRLVQDPVTGLVHNGAFDPDALSYDDSYQNEQGHSAAFKAHMAQVLDLVGRRFGDLSILEIGCGKGSFLEMLRAAGHDARGVDPAYEGDADYIVRKHFAPGLGIRGDAIVMRHVLEHIPSPMRFLENIRAANGGGGRVYIEVPCLEWILRNNAWFDVFYEHVNYFRLADFGRMFGRVLESGPLFGGQYIYAIAELDSLRAADDDAFPPSAPVAFPATFFAGLDECARLAASGPPAAVWGAAAKGVMFTHHLLARGARPALAIDINPAKQTRFLAGSGLEVLAPEAGLAQLGGKPNVFVMNSNYLSEIRTQGGPGPNYIAVDHL